jgi:hypothetical protein
MVTLSRAAAAPAIARHPSASVELPREESAARRTALAYDRRGQPGQCTLHSPANVKPARDTGPRGPASAEADPGAAGAPQ